jgi:L-amino acid N-acyltransferase YncA
MSNSRTTLRAAKASDIPAIYEIQKHYILNTVITFKIEVTSEQALLENMKNIQEQKLPYIVAESESNEIVGYAYVTGFRSGKAGYKHTVELSLFCHPEHLSKGIGTALLVEILDLLSHPENNPELLNIAPREEDRRVRHVIACMAVDTDGRNEGLGLKEWYEGFGFVFKGQLSEVGFKFDRWYVLGRYLRIWRITHFIYRIDTIYLQKTLWPRQDVDENSTSN